jgi:ubiquinone/menaquinone biosynthesis C-methylase UbiE
VKKPLLVNLLKAAYNKFFPSSTFAHKVFWKYRFSGSGVRIDDCVVKTTLNHAHRLEIISEFKKFTNVNSVLELGSSWGANLLLIRNEYPDVRFLGVDISKQMVDSGNEYYRSQNIENINLIQRDMTSLKSFRDDEFDIIISDASLIYIDNKRINDLAVEMSRIAKIGFIIVAFDDDSKDSTGRVFQANWIRDYETVFQQFSRKIEKRSFDENVWPGKWSEYGKIITVFLNKGE